MGSNQPLTVRPTQRDCIKTMTIYDIVLPTDAYYPLDANGAAKNNPMGPS